MFLLAIRVTKVADVAVITEFPTLLFSSKTFFFISGIELYLAQFVGLTVSGNACSGNHKFHIHSVDGQE